mmetsp:Transcript_58625/g.164468  ORF Transcript_58625/g.164468 Transcript_58625/m.164468 type:complete len:225 (+) Transcript_58625:664-1338(+)
MVCRRRSLPRSAAALPHRRQSSTCASAAASKLRAAGEDKLISERLSSGLEVVAACSAAWPAQGPEGSLRPSRSPGHLCRWCCSADCSENVFLRRLACSPGGGSDEDEEVARGAAALSEAPSGTASSPTTSLPLSTAAHALAAGRGKDELDDSHPSATGKEAHEALESRRPEAELVRTEVARRAYSSVLLESSKWFLPGCTLAIIATMPSPVREPLSISVSFESL